MPDGTTTGTFEGLATGLMPRATISQICAHRRQALVMFENAYAAMTAADDAITAARKALALASPREVNRYNHHNDPVENCFFGGLKLPEADLYRATARRLVDTDVWAFIVETTDLERLMDRTAKADLHRSLMENPPEVTEENVFATLQQFMLDADMIFRRGIAKCFSSLDRRFRSHDGWKIGARVILDHAFNEYGRWNYYRDQQAAIQDIERTFLTLDGRQVPPSYAGILGAIDRERGIRWDRRQSETENEYFKIRIFKNGNAHIWFKRDDLVRQVNKLLGEYYGEVIPEEREPDKDTGFHDAKTSIAKRYGFFPTPDEAVSRVFNDFPMYRREGEPAFTVLEPSAGTGQLARKAAELGGIVDCVEIQPRLADDLRMSGIYRRVIPADFLALSPNPAALYDRIVMNPPFDRERDIDHVMHALKFLKPEGCLTAVMSAGTEFRETRKATAFRDLMQTMGATWSDLPAGSFSSVGTNVNTRIVKVWANGRQRRY